MLLLGLAVTVSALWIAPAVLRGVVSYGAARRGLAVAAADAAAGGRVPARCIAKPMAVMIAARKLHAARQHLKRLGFNRETAKYWVAFLPEWVLDLRRAILKRPIG